MKPSSKNLIWLDMEMTGLDPDKDRIIEIAMIATDSQLNILAESHAFAIHQSPALLANMDQWNTEHHTASGLVKQVQESVITEQEAEMALLHFLKAHVPKGKSPLCGSSIHQDRRFLRRYMPVLDQYFNYRLLDVSTLKELALRWAPDIAKGFNKVSAHTALSDIRDSIAELKYYREHLFKEDLTQMTAR